MNWSECDKFQRISIILLLILFSLFTIFLFIFIPIHLYNESVDHKNRMEYYKYRIVTKSDCYYTNDYEEIGNCIIINNVKNCGDYKIEIINKE